MQQPEKEPGNVRRAAAFFRQPAWMRLLDAIYHKYIEQGGARGRVVLRDCAPEEQREIARFLHRSLADRPELAVRLADFQLALNASGFACELSDLLRELFPERSHVTRNMQRQRQARVQQTFDEALAELVADLPADSRGRLWLLNGQHGRASLFRRYKNEAREFQQQILNSTRLVVAALESLPESPRLERLALFAQRVSGDPHALDANTLAGRLFWQSLADLNALTRQESQVVPEGEPEPEEAPARVESEQEQERLLLYMETGLLVDTLSSTVATFHLASARDSAVCIDPLVEHAGERILVLPLRQLLAWEKVYPASAQVYLFENPQVFEEIVDGLVNSSLDRPEEKRGMLPTLICTSGWPSVAAIQLLAKIVNAVPRAIFYYSGDFDLQGLRIAAHLLARYPHNCQLWRFDPSSYLTALHTSSVNLDPGDLAALRALPAVFAPLTAAMQEKGQKAYQEGIAPLLLKDIQRIWLEK
ncbi:MAG TPA: TIGR02679 family protein [Ktedonobacteraceae bacterium]